LVFVSFLLLWSYPDARQGASFTVAMARRTEGAAANTPVDAVALDFGPPGDTNCVLLAWSSIAHWCARVDAHKAELLCLRRRHLGRPARASCSRQASRLGSRSLRRSCGCSTRRRALVGGGEHGREPVRRPVTVSDGRLRGLHAGTTRCSCWTARRRARGEAINMGCVRSAVRVLALDPCPRPPRARSWNTVAQLSDTGAYLAYSGQDAAYVLNWSATQGAYTLAFQVQREGESGGAQGSPSRCAPLRCYCLRCCCCCCLTPTRPPAPLRSCAPRRLQHVVLRRNGRLLRTARAASTASWRLGSIGAGRCTARVLIVSMVTGKILTDYSTPQNTQLQTNPTLRMDGDFCGSRAWGAGGRAPGMLHEGVFLRVALVFALSAPALPLAASRSGATTTTCPRPSCCRRAPPPPSSPT